MKTFALSLITVAILGACADNTSNVTTGVFVDAPVEGLSYTSGAISGTTDATGRFLYTPGATVNFSVGSVTLPPVAGAALAGRCAS